MRCTRGFWEKTPKFGHCVPRSVPRNMFPEVLLQNVFCKICSAKCSAKCVPRSDLGNVFCKMCSLKCSAKCVPRNMFHEVFCEICSTKCVPRCVPKCSLKETSSDKMKTIMITCLMKLMSLTIDEVSMVSLRDLNIRTTDVH